MAELLALLIEVTSVTAAGKNLRKPVEVPRPHGRNKPQQQRAAADTDAAYKRGISVLANTARPRR
jgi:hypothetical protein